MNEASSPMTIACPVPATVHRHAKVPPKTRASTARFGPLLIATALAGCQFAGKEQEAAALSPEQARAIAQRAVPARVKDRNGWASDIQTSFSLLGLPATSGSICATVAVIEQESGFQVNPSVQGLPSIAWKSIEERASRYGVPAFMVRAAMALPSGDGRSYATRIDNARTELDLSQTFEDMIGNVPLGKKLFGRFNPVRTGGAMQVSIDFAEKHVANKKYPYADAGSIRDEVFTRRGGLYFGIAHLLDYPADYPEMKFRFADFNAGHYASRNAAFQRALAVATGRKLVIDGDLIDHNNPGKAGQTEQAARILGKTIGLNDANVRKMLETSNTLGFQKTPLYVAAFQKADAAGSGNPMPRALVPDIELNSPKITRKLTTAWFTDRVNTRYQNCLKRVNEGRK